MSAHSSLTPSSPVRRRPGLLQILLALIWTLGVPVGIHAQAPAPLLQAADLQYLGAIRVPGGTFGSSTFEYGGTAPAFHAANNSLFLVGHPYQTQVAELSLPTPVNSGSLSALPTAKVLQPFTDPSHGLMFTVGAGTTYTGGLLEYQNRLVGTSYLYYDGTGGQSLSHFVNTNPGSLAAGTAQGMYKVGSVGAGFVDGYMGLIPPEWQTALGGPVLTGQCCIPIISRTSYGPAVFAFDPANLGVTNPAPAKPLVYYPQSNPLADYAATSVLFNGATAITGVVFPSGTRSVLFFGRQGQGPFCYGPGTADPSLAGTPAPGGVDAYCYDPTDNSKGTHSYPYAYQVWGYDATALAAVAAGSTAPYAVRPYATWTLPLPFASGADLVGGTAWDPATRRLYLVVKYGDGILPLIHVYQIGTGAAAAAPVSPANLQVR